MATPKGGKEVELPTVPSNQGPSGLGTSPGLIAAMSRAWNDWFGPGVPITPVAPAQDVAGRQFDFPYSVNLNTRPKGEPGENSISYGTLRRLADPPQGGLDLLRLVIETRKDEMTTQRWTIRGREQNDDGGEEARNIEIQLRKPDGEHTWLQWLKMLLEDHMVIDAVAVYPRKVGDRTVLELVDGSTIKRLIDGKGRTPLPPFPAYQQYLKGMPAIDYRLDELRFYVGNPRTNKLYGMSRVEQVVNMVSLALLRFVHVRDYYTAGTVPDVLIGVPETWSADQIKKFQMYWDELLTDNLAEKRKARFVPNGMKTTVLKEEILKNDFDEWLARIVAFCFSCSPEALVKQTNRATAETGKEAAAEQGLQPLKEFIADIMNDLLAEVFMRPDLCLSWKDDEIQDPTAKVTVTTALAGGKALITVNEGRGMWGLAPATPDELEEMNPTPPPPIIGDGSDGGDGQNPPPKGQKKLPPGAEKLGKRRSLPRGYPPTRTPEG